MSSTTDQARAAALAAKREDQRVRDGIKSANNRALRAMPADVADRVRAAAVSAMADARRNGDRRSSVYFLRDAITAYEVARDEALAEEHDRGEHEVRTCRTCKKDKPVAEFPSYRPGQCRPCYNAQWKKWNAAKAAAKAAQVSA